MSERHYENFPVASLLCPAALRPAVMALYGFARTADDLADEGQATPQQRRARLRAFRGDLDAVLSGRPASGRWPQVFAALAQAVQQHDLPGEPLHALLDASFAALVHGAWSALHQDLRRPFIALDAGRTHHTILARWRDLPKGGSMRVPAREGFAEIIKHAAIRRESEVRQRQPQKQIKATTLGPLLRRADKAIVKSSFCAAGPQCKEGFLALDQAGRSRRAGVSPSLIFTDGAVHGTRRLRSPG